MPNIGEWYSDGYRHYQVIPHDPATVRAGSAYSGTHTRLRSRYTNERFIVSVERFRSLRGPIPTGSIGDYVP